MISISTEVCKKVNCRKYFEKPTTMYDCASGHIARVERFCKCRLLEGQCKERTWGTGHGNCPLPKKCLNRNLHIIQGKTVDDKEWGGRLCNDCKFVKENK